MRGFLAPEWLNHIGAHFRIDPEFFRRHVDFIESQRHFDLPTLPSASSHILTLPLITIGTRIARVAPTGVLAQSRRETTRLNVLRELRNFEKSRAVGQSIVRDVSLHDESHFTVEQDVSVYVQQRSGSWLGNGIPRFKSAYPCTNML